MVSDELPLDTCGASISQLLRILTIEDYEP